MTRIVAGRARGRRLAVPPAGTRPTAERVREAMFSSLESRFGALAGLRVLDLYAGSGALGLEALSRGAAHVLLVESDPKAVRTLRSNVVTVGLDGAEVRALRVDVLLDGKASRPYDVVLADPPYDTAAGAVTGLLRRLVTGRWLEPDAVVVVERARKAEPLRWPEGLVGQRERRYGETMLWYGHPAD